MHSGFVTLVMRRPLLKANALRWRTDHHLRRRWEVASLRASICRLTISASFGSVYCSGSEQCLRMRRYPGAMYVPAWQRVLFPRSRVFFIASGVDQGDENTWNLVISI